MKLHDHRSRASALSEINVTPLVDVMLVLLIIFMVTAPMMVRGIEVELPRAASSQDVEGPRVEITLDRQGRLWIGERPVQTETLRREMEQLSRSRPGSGVYLRADGQAHYGDVLGVMDLIRTSGVENIAMITLPAPPIPSRDRPATGGR